ncbi:putative AdoMet-dependent methyltransferase [Scopulibacillus darangshiensis]|uniref:Uncharacterized methyltransferase EV207_101275 n=1 Tax=Scopulibacillus darangshiensis TaxID=442528 RepID=A0A4V2SNS6_9BACL|nr:class I SAM-dependent methyltransferase [Scopulibacillus darangshiensis]TCP32296.1 putative AdoMet-dependent methyltransferase [Scopulibacillus darangshiensis]
MGREFIDLFDVWAEKYDETVSGNDIEYQEVFDNYDGILQIVANFSKGTILEFGVGTGNLTEKLLLNGHKVFGVEPSKGMRDKAKEKFPDLDLCDGDFLTYPAFKKEINTIVSSYAFHHLTDREKETAIRAYSQLLPADGKIVFADTMFDDKVAKQEILDWAEQKGHHNLLADLQAEYYPLRETMEKIFEKNQFHAEFKQLNRFVWLICAKKE